MIEQYELAEALAAADEEKLTALANRGIYKRALKDTEGQTADMIQSETAVVVKMGDERCIIRAPLEKSSCTCPSRTVCRHIIGAILLLRKELPEDLPEKPEQTPPVPEEKPAPETEPEPQPAQPELLSAADTEQVRECARQGLKQLGGLLARGLIRADPSAAEELELTAVSAHAARMADAERGIRSLCKMLTECTERRASFDAGSFTHLLCRCTELLLSLDKPEITVPELGTFRAEYVPYGRTLEILPLGSREIRGGAYEGTVYYFLNMDESAPERFLSYSDLRPAYYGYSRRKLPAANVWGLSSSLQSMMRSRMTLAGARLNGSRLSGSSSTRVLSTAAAALDCPQLRRLIIYDYRELAYLLKGDEERPFLIRIEELAGYGFNKYGQYFKMAVKDTAGRQLGMYIKYRAETKQTVEQAENLCKDIKGQRGVWTALVLGRMSGGKVVLEPVRFYNFIDAANMHAFTPDSFYDPGDAVFAERLLEQISQLEESLMRIVRSGLSSVQEDHTSLPDGLRAAGMVSLAGLAEKCFASAEGYRHHIEDGGEDALIRMTELMRYIRAAKNRLSRLTAIADMESRIDNEE